MKTDSKTFKSGLTEPTLLGSFYARTQAVLKTIHQKLWASSHQNCKKLKVWVKPGAKPPIKKRPQDAGFDFYVFAPHLLDGGSYGDYINLCPGEVIRLSTGCYCEFPKDTMWLWDVRSSWGLKGVDVTCRTIDNEYRGELSVVIVNNDAHNTVKIRHNDRIAQLIPNPFSSEYEIEVVSSREQLSESSRGEKGFGSSGTN